MLSPQRVLQSYIMPRSNLLSLGSLTFYQTPTFKFIDEKHFLELDGTSCLNGTIVMVLFSCLLLHDCTHIQTISRICVPKKHGRVDHHVLPLG